ncbi:hypothetical protein NDU88_006960 [Pleurodeles waltl]|uniref:Uncharacterized protein n=1 Tax=Pleurodeles waltl TaxID=8319 RepID=A0AAV7QJC3_PLEWA|nr:hypothetical protein NDU88_006960 [Pleurodeles waltl]
MRIPRGTPPGWPPGLDHQRKAKRGESEGRDLLETGSQEPQLRSQKRKAQKLEREYKKRSSIDIEKKLRQAKRIYKTTIRQRKWAYINRNWETITEVIRT